MTLDYNALQFWLGLVNLLGVVVIGIYTWWAGRDRATASAIAAVNQRVEQNEREIYRLDLQVKDSLRLKDLSDLYESVSDINREMGAFSANLKAANDQLRLHQEFLMSSGR